MMNRLRTVAALALALSIGNSVANGDEIRFARYPHISNDGLIAFSYHGDIWIAAADGSAARRLTAHIARDTFPRFSPDGQWIAFDSDRMGNGDVWIVSVDGGPPRQITLNTTDDSVQYWTPDGTGLIITTSRGAGPWGSPLHIAPIDGGIPRPLGMDRGAAGMIRQDGTTIAFNRVGFRYWRKHYRGNNNTDIWLQDLATGELRQLTDRDVKAFREHAQDAYPMWGADGQIYYMSERNGTFNVWRIDPDGGEPQQVTSHKSDGVQYPAISPNGKWIVYENEFQLWKLSVDGGNPAKIELDLSFDPKDNLTKVSTAEGEADGIAPSNDGEFLAVDHHGEIFIIPADPELGEKTQVTHSPWRDRNQLYAPDGKTIAYISDQSGDEEIWLYDVAASQHRQLTHHESLKSDVTWSRDSRKIAFEADSKIFLADAASGEISEVAHNPEGGYRGITFSSDGNWLVYSRSNKDLNSEVYLFDLVNRKEINVTDSRFSEASGTLTADGKHVVFASDRSGSFELYAVSLSKVTEDPDDPLVKKKLAAKKKPSRKRREEQDSDKSGDASEDETEDETENDEAKVVKKPLELVVELDGIRHRARRLTTGSGSGGDPRSRFGGVSYLASPDGQTLYYRRGGKLYSVGIDGGNAKSIADGSFSGLTLTADGKTFFYRDGSGLYQMGVNGSGKKKISFQLRVMIDVRKEWEQVFEESWRVMKYRFYDENMHGFDWDAIKARYKPMLKYVGENQDLYDLCNEMIGELNASHTGVSGPPTRSMDSLYSTRQLGFELEGSGEYYRVAHIYPLGPADKEWVDLKVGDVVLAIEGHNIRDGDNYHSILNQLLNDYVDVTVASPGEAADAGSTVLGEKRSVRIRSVSSVSGLKYEAWVENNRRYVDEQSGGKVGYVHIRSMNQSSLTRFEQEIDQFWNKNGMIIDIRYNGGGNIDQQLIDILERKPYEYWNFRNGGRARGRRPRQAIAGPQVMLINWRSASDSEVTPQAFRDLKLGRIVGNPTYGAVIATGSYSLMNGARIRTPGSLVVTYDPTKLHNYGINLENFGVAPDVWVENTPDDELAGFDRELKAAVDEALRMLKKGTWQFGEDD